MTLSPSIPLGERTDVSRSLMRALDILDAVSTGPISLVDITTRLGLTRSTAYRLASALVDRGLLRHDPRKGYQLGPRILTLGAMAHESADLIAIAQPSLDALSLETGDATNLAIRDGEHIVYVGRAPSRRLLAVRHQLGDRNRVDATALGRALLMDAPSAVWRASFPAESQDTLIAEGFSRHIGEDGERICCVAAPVRDASGEIIAALSLSSAQQYMSADQMDAAGRQVAEAATAVSRRLGWTP
ncbi:IclR family transcriptional regulator [Caulobacter sp.]|uniref:IclR family transcriptional regulator n=1 Tax=Caulobacter sp. TaxID=78 RepID=UPI001B11B21D|nr:IclR family transcriptional regulator [Caulobacter sp.]MBO9545136.1 IclR family transcriptional regulator [Caulobacter sp.]